MTALGADCTALCSVNSVAVKEVSLQPCAGIAFSKWADFGRRGLNIAFSDQVFISLCSINMADGLHAGTTSKSCNA